MLQRDSIRLKRLKKEILNSDLLNNNFSIIYDKYNIKLVIEECYIFIIHNDYPFKKPIFYINNQKYEDFLIPINKYIKNIIIEYFKCPHCISILNFWSPTNVIVDLIKEYKEVKKTYYKCYILYFIQTILGKYINDKYLNNNILEYIL